MMEILAEGRMKVIFPMPKKSFHQKKKKNKRKKKREIEQTNQFFVTDEKLSTL